MSNAWICDRCNHVLSDSKDVIRWKLSFGKISRQHENGYELEDYTKLDICNDCMKDIQHFLTER